MLSSVTCSSFQGRISASGMPAKLSSGTSTVNVFCPASRRPGVSSGPLDSMHVSREQDKSDALGF